MHKVRIMNHTETKDFETYLIETEYLTNCFCSNCQQKFIAYDNTIATYHLIRCRVQGRNSLLCISHS